jgi:glutamate formiminotransferase/formiminotetrahydrofolate cyclodeaminase
MVRSELVGLIPQAALVDAAAWYLRLEGFRADQILEVRLQEARQAESATGFLDRLAAPTATPGGGSAAAYAGAMAAGLVAMVAQLTRGKKKYESVHPQMGMIAAQAAALKESLSASVEQDSRAFDDVMEALRLPKESPEQAQVRKAAIERATHRAALVPLRVAQDAARVLELAAETAALGNVNALSDAASAGLLAGACLRAAGLNVLVNAKSVEDRRAAESWERDLAEARRAADQAEARLQESVVARGGLSI